MRVEDGRVYWVHTGVEISMPLGSFPHIMSIEKELDWVRKQEAHFERQRRKSQKRTATRTATCEDCGSPFVSSRSTARYCSATCRKRASRRRAAAA